jgi:hypothetical protein
MLAVVARKCPWAAHAFRDRFAYNRLYAWRTKEQSLQRIAVDDR